MVLNGIMTQQISLRLPENILKNANEYAEVHGFGSIQDFIREVLREKLFDEPNISEEESILVQKLAEASNKKNLYGTEEELFKKLKRK